MNRILQETSIKKVLLMIACCGVSITLMIFVVLFSGILQIKSSILGLNVYATAVDCLSDSLANTSRAIKELQSNHDEENLSTYLDYSHELDSAIESVYEKMISDESRNTLRRLSAFNDYQRKAISINDTTHELYYDLAYASDGFSLHMIDFLNMYNNEVSRRLALYDQSISPLIRNTLIALMLFIVFFILIYCVFSYLVLAIRNSISTLVIHMDNIACHNWNIIGEKQRRGFKEFNVLFVKIDFMERKLHEYIIKLDETSQIEKKLIEEKLKNERQSRMLIASEMDMLKAQVNTHFLFNALQQIGLATLLKSPQEVLEMVECTGKILRYSLYNKEEMVKIEDEIMIAEIFCRLQKLCLGNVRFEIDFSNDWHCMIPPMCLQPIVENSFKHNQDFEGKEFIIRLSIKGSQENTIVTVFDNGKGFSKDKTKTKGTSGLGLENIKQRLYLCYKRADLMSISSKEGEYAAVTIIFPKRIKGEE